MGSKFFIVGQCRTDTTAPPVYAFHHLIRAMTDQRSISIQVTPADDQPGVLELRIAPDGSIRASQHPLTDGPDPNVVQGWSVRVARVPQPLSWTGPELLIFAPAEGGSGGKWRCPLPTEDGKVVILGRSRRACDIVIPDEHVSRVHLKITAAAGGHTLEDAQSRWGTHINGRRLDTRHVLVHGDEIRIGTSTIRYVTRWDESALRPTPEREAPCDDRTNSDQTHDLAPEFALEHVERARTHSNTPPPAVRQVVSPLWLGIGIGIMMALVAMIIYTLVLWLWPQG